MQTQLIAARRALTPDGRLAPYWMEIAAGQSGTAAAETPDAGVGRILAAGEGPPPRTPDLEVRGILSPGFVDVHCHGGGGHSFAEGPQQARQAAAAHRAQGTTTLLASLVTDPLPALRESLQSLAPLVEVGELAGVHLEGPWLSPQHKGAHSEEFLQPPRPEDVADLLSTGTVAMVTLAPELPGGLDAVRQMVSHGAVAAVGHTDATYQQVSQALDAGASAGTHLFNAMRGLHHREPGPAGALLEHGSAFLELIADGVHLHPAMLRLIFAQHAERAVLVSDAMAAAAAEDGDYRLGSLLVRVRGGEARVVAADGTAGAIAGSTLTVGAAVRFAVQEAGVPAEQALTAATANPAAMLGLDEVGSLAEGGRADLVVLDEEFGVERVMQAGAWVG